ncbi:Trimeric LpxA-like [Vigna unguiculata]|uniref:Trimeric LpxA-like n=1 Tax=Vigna unguiculata TaxID=3917 RepID=A0A4D6NFW6_VIGUN|nr:Trimeric LpxA-like [Vigna unguiculata]
MGRFERNKGFKYVGGGDVKLWWKGSKEKLLNNLRMLDDDKEAMALANFAEETKEEVDIYVQHVPSQPEVIHFICDGIADEVVAEENVVHQEEVLVEESVVGEEDVFVEDDVVVEEEEVAADNVVVEEEEVAVDNVVVEDEVVAQQNVVAEEEVVVEDVNCEDE